MNENQSAAFKILEQAQSALKSGDKETARTLANQASNLAPELEEVWLLMAALAVPRESISFLEMALQINPDSERARKGLAWAQERVRRDQQVAVSPSAPVIVEEQKAPEQEEPQQVAAVEPERLSAADNQKQAEVSQASPVEEKQTDTAPIPAFVPAVPREQKKKSVQRTWYAIAVVLIALICLAIVWAGWQGVTPVTALLANSFAVPSHGATSAEVHIAKPQDSSIASPVPTSDASAQATSAPLLVSVTPTEGSQATAALAAPTAIPTDTVPATATPTAVPPTDTALPANDTSVSPTDTYPASTSTLLPTPSDTALAPTDTQIVLSVIQPTATPDLAQIAQASPTPLPTDTAVAGPTLLAVATPIATPVANATLPTPKSPSLSGVSGHWFDVDLTSQMLYAYDGSTLVNSFLVSTGTWQYPTVTGQYHIYVKYRYTNMAGPGYYLPNVPFTMYFYQGYGLHGTYWHHNFGHPMSHGCVNLSIPESEWVYNFGSIGTLVNVHN